jgi:hypothetical protein
MSKLTVVTPTIEGREKFLQQNRKTVEAQTVGALPHLVMLDENRDGPSAIRNRLVEEVETPWVLFLDDDDWLEYDYYETVEPFLTDDYDVVYTWCKRLGFKDNLDVEFDPERLKQGNFIPVTACVRVERFHEVGGFPEGVAYEDWALWVNTLKAGGKFHVIKEKKWTYRRHGGSRTHENQHKVASGQVKAR